MKFKINNNNKRSQIQFKNENYYLEFKDLFKNNK